MKQVFAIAFTALLIAGCAPKMGKDILIEPEGSVRLESSKSEVMLGVLSLLGASVKNEPIRLGGDIKVTNKWHSDLKLISLTYALNDEKESFAQGEANMDKAHPIVVASGEQKIISFSLRIDPKRLSVNRILGIVQSSHPLFIKGEAVIEVWGVQKHYFFEKEATKLIQKALK